MRDLLIIGGVAAGATAAARARRLNGDINITLLEAGEDVSFANCGLPYYIGGDVAYRSSLLLASPSTFFDQYRVDVHVNTEAVRLDREKKMVVAKNRKTGEESEFRYDTLILAQGGKPIVPPLPGVERDHVFQLWTLADMDAIDLFINERSPETAVVVGGGFIGLEMVEALAKRGLKVELVERLPHVMPNLEAEFAGFLTKELLDYGVKVHTGVALQTIGDGDVVLDDGQCLNADMVIVSVGVKPTLTLAKEAGLATGPMGGLKVDNSLRTTDPAIFAAGDMVEVAHGVSGAASRIPLAGPANRQGRIAAENALGGEKKYQGTLGTSVVKVFGAVTASTGLSLEAAREAGIAADAVVVHKVSHTAYYPGSENVGLMLVYSTEDHKVLGAQACGRVGVEKRIDVVATAIAGGLTVDNLEELDLAYAPPFNSPNGPVNMAAFTAMNKINGFSPSIPAMDVDDYVQSSRPAVIDLRDPLSFHRANIEGSNNISHNELRDALGELRKDMSYLLISEDGQKGHVALRMLKNAGIKKVHNLSGGYLSLERHARAVGYKTIRVGLFKVDERSVDDLEAEKSSAGHEAGAPGNEEIVEDSQERLVIDVRTPMEYEMGAYPGAVNIPLDDLMDRVDEVGDKDREIIVYCASGARSSYARRLLDRLGYTNVTNGGGLHDVQALNP